MLRLRSTRPLAVLALVAVVPALVASCDDKKTETTTSAPSATVDQKAVMAQIIASANAAASASAAAATAQKKPKRTKDQCPAGTEIDVPDKALEADLRKKLAKPTGPITKDELKNVKSVNLTSATSVDDLDPCVFPLLTGMKDLFLGPGELSDLSPISTLAQLVTLRASINKVSDLKPLERMTSLDRLDISKTAVRDLSVISKLVNLTELSMDDTEVRDLTPLAKLTKLERLSIQNTPVTDVSPLKNLHALKYLYVAGSAVGDTTAIAPLTGGGLKIVRTARNP